MAIYPLPKRFNPDFRVKGKKPVSGGLKIDWSHPFSRGLWGVYIFNDGVPVNLVNGNVAEIQGNASISVRNGERSLKTINGNDRIVLNNGPLGTKNVSVIGRAAYDVAQDSTLLDVNNQKLLLWADHLTGTLRPSVFAGGAQYGIAGSLPHDGTYKTWGARLKQNGTSADAWISLEGEVEIGPVNAGSIDFTNNGTGDISIGANFSQTSKTTRGNTSFVFIWTRTLEDSEMSSLIDDPYQILEPATPSYYFIPEAPAPITGGYIPRQLPKRYHPDFRIPNKIPLGNVSLDRSNNLGASTLLHYLPRGNYFEELAENKVYASTENPQNGITGFNQYGPYMECTDPHEIAVPNIFFGATDSYSISWLAAKNDPVSSKGMVCGDLSSTQNFIWQRVIDGSVTIRRANRTSTIQIPEVGHDELVWRTLVFDYTGSSVNLHFYAKGLSATTVLNADAFVVNGIACGYSGNGFDYDGKFQGLIIHDKALSETEVLSLHADPYQSLKPKTPLVYFTVGGDVPPPVGLAIPIVMYHRRQFNRG